MGILDLFPKPPETKERNRAMMPFDEWKERKASYLLAIAISTTMGGDRAKAIRELIWHLEQAHQGNEFMDISVPTPIQLD